MEIFCGELLFLTGDAFGGDFLFDYCWYFMFSLLRKNVLSWACYRITCVSKMSRGQQSMGCALLVPVSESVRKGLGTRGFDKIKYPPSDSPVNNAKFAERTLQIKIREENISFN